MPLIEELRHPEEKKESLNTDAVTSITVAMSVAIIILVVVFVYSKKRRKKLSFLEQRYQRDNHGHANYYDLNGHNRPDFSSLTSPPVVADVWELPHSCLKLGQVLGTGAFGMVMEGQVSYAMLRHREVQVPLKDRKGRLLVTVAVKMLQEGVDSRYYRDFIQEINLMKKIGYHVNVVSMFGCCTLREPICLVVEHMPLGDLLHYLKKIRHILITQEDSMGHYQNREAEHLTPLDLLSFARQIVRGMEFLSGKSFVHRDLAARNILVDENKVLKIGDFGLTRYIYDDKVYVNRRGGKLPIKWMSVEAIFELTFSTASDVWSYGILLFELMTLGGSPYPGISNQELLLKLRNGYRMECPDNCAVEIYQLMRDCWKTNPKERPSFTDIRKRIDVMITECSGQEYLDLQLDESQDYYQVETSEDDDSVLELNMDAQANDDAGERGTVVEETSLTEESPSVVVRQRSTDKVLVTTHKKIHPGSTDEEFKLSVASYKGGKHERFAAGCSSQECSLERTQSGRLPCCNPENNSQSTLERGKSENIPRKITSDVNRKPGSPDPVEGLGRLQKRCQRGYQRYLKHRNGQADAAENHEGQTAEMDNRDRESDSSYSQLDGSDDVFSDGLYTMPYSYLQRPSDLEGLPSTDSSPTESDLSDGFFQAGSLSIIYGPKRLRMASEVSTTSIDSGLPQSPTQTDFSPRSSPQYISRYTKHQSITGQARKTKLRRLTRITSTEPTLPSVVNSDEDITSSSL